MVKTRSAILKRSPRQRDENDRAQNAVPRLAASTALVETPREPEQHSARAQPSAESVSVALQRILKHVTIAVDDLAKIQPAQLLYERGLAEINLRLRHLFGSIHENHSRSSATIENDIVQCAGELTMMQISGLRDAEVAHKEQVAAVFQRLTDVVLTEVPPNFLQISLQKIVSGDLKPNFEHLHVPRSNSADEEYLDNQCQTSSQASDDEVKGVPNDRLGGDPQGFQKRSKSFAEGHSQSEQHDQDEKQRRKRAKTDVKIISVESQPENGHKSKNVTLQNEDNAKLGVTSHEKFHGDRQAVVLEVVDSQKRRHELRLRPRGAERADRILDRQIIRPVQLSRGVLFSAEGQAAMRDNEIISSLIQTSGNVMENPCTHCKHGSRTPFEDCIMIVDDENFDRCGNCEWIGGDCQGGFISATAKQPPDPAGEFLPFRNTNSSSR
ncbi:hypothetical protein ARSEF1564_008420 [Beauveria bassiana]